MYYTNSTSEGKTMISLHGEIDHHSAKLLRAELDEIIDRERPDILILDLSDIAFCDSSGLGLIMGRYKKVKTQNGELIIYSPSDSVSRMMNLSGMDKLVKTLNGKE